MYYDSKTCHSCLVLRGVSYCRFCAHTIQCNVTTCSNSNQKVIRCTSSVTLPCTCTPQNNSASTHRHMVCILHRVCTGAIILCTLCTGMHVQYVHMSGLCHYQCSAARGYIVIMCAGTGIELLHYWWRLNYYPVLLLALAWVWDPRYMYILVDNQNHYPCDFLMCTVLFC